MKKRANLSFHTRTPTIQVFDNRGSNILILQYYRPPKRVEQLDERITLKQFSTAGFLVKSADPQLRLIDINNIVCCHNLLGETLLVQSVDTGNSVVLNDIEGRLMTSIDANETTRTCQYERNTSLGRLVSISEQLKNSEPYISEHFVYAKGSSVEQQANLVGQCISHYDTAGLLKLNQVSLQGISLSTTRHFLREMESGETRVDWQNQKEQQLEGQAYDHQVKVDAMGSILQCIDGEGHQQRQFYNITGQLKYHWLSIQGQNEQWVIKSVDYLATNQKQQEEYGNGVITYYEYEPQTQYLISVKTLRPNTHPLGFKLFQYVHYEYDPVGNILCIRNEAEQLRFWCNQKVIPEQRYQYDSLYQLISASGREMATNSQQSSLIPHYTAFDQVTYTQYCRFYTYDLGGNLARIHHHSPATNQNYSLQITTSDRSNRAVIQSLSAEPSKVDQLFTSSGQQKQLSQGQYLDWTPRQELQSVSCISLNESYRYDHESQRVFKINKQGRSCRKTWYLPNLELKSTEHNGITTECLHIIQVGEISGSQIQILHWKGKVPDGISNDVWRYHIDFLAGNGGLELDNDGQLISREEFYPYGGTAIWVARNQVEANYKTRRYSGKERDVTGLYYYGYRYYQPWAGRWLSADPAGTADGLNFYRMSRNNPINYSDPNGLFPFQLLNPFHWVREISRRREERRAMDDADYSYIFMANGRSWYNRFYNKATFDRLTHKNMQDLRKISFPLNELESNFVERFKGLDFSLLHASTVDFMQKGEVTFKSRVELSRTNAISYLHDNTTYGDEMNLQTKEFVFFSLGIDGAEGKGSSRFGDKLYVTPLSSVEDSPNLPHSHIAINDTLRYSYRQTSPRLRRTFGRDDSQLLNDELIASEASETVYAYKDFKEAIALRMVTSAKILSKEAYTRIMKIQDNQEFDNFMSLLYRPQLLIPNELKSKNTTVRTIQYRPQLMGF